MRPVPSLLVVASLLALAGRVLNLRARSAPDPGPPFAARRHEIQWQGTRLVFWEAGEGPPLLLVHGIYAGASAYEWRRIVPALAEKHRVVAVDLPGFGASCRQARLYSAATYVDCLGELRERLFAEPPEVIAAGLSGAFAIGAAASRPGFCSRLVLSCPTGLEALSQPAGALRLVVRSALSLPGLGDAATVLLGRRRTVGRYLRNYTYFDERELEPEAIEYFRAQVLRPGARYALAAYMAGALNRDVRAELDRVQVPLDIVWGRQAEFTPAEQSLAFIDRQPAARLHILERCGNAPQMERPAEFVEIVDGSRALG